MILGVQFCYTHSIKIKGSRKMRFRPGFNVLVGPNGSGKSTVLRALHTCEACDIESDNRGEVHYFNIELMNPHAQSGPVGDMRNMVLRARGTFSSHGEIMRTSIGSLPIREGDVLLIDEPEAGQDAEGVERVRRGLEAICAKGGQVIAASHHPFMWGDAHVIELAPGYLSEVRKHYCKEVCSNPAQD